MSQMLSLPVEVVAQLPDVLEQAVKIAVAGVTLAEGAEASLPREKAAAVAAQIEKQSGSSLGEAWRKSATERLMTASGAVEVLERALGRMSQLQTKIAELESKLSEESRRTGYASASLDGGTTSIKQAYDSGCRVIGGPQKGINPATQALFARLSIPIRGTSS